MNPPFRFDPNPIYRLRPSLLNAEGALSEPEMPLRLDLPSEATLLGDYSLRSPGLGLAAPSLGPSPVFPRIVSPFWRAPDLSHRYSAFAAAPPWDGQIDEPDWVQTVVELLRSMKSANIRLIGIPTYEALESCQGPQFVPNGTLNPGRQQICTQPYTYSNTSVEIRPDRNIGESVLSNYNVEYVGPDFRTSRPLDSSQRLPVLPALGQGLLGVEGFFSVQHGASFPSSNPLGRRSETPLTSSVALCQPNQTCSWSLFYFLSGMLGGVANGREDAQITGFWSALGLNELWYQIMNLPENEIFTTLRQFVEYVIRPFLSEDGRRALGVNESTWNANNALFNFSRMHDAQVQILMDSRRFFVPEAGHFETLPLAQAQAEIQARIRALQASLVSQAPSDPASMPLPDAQQIERLRRQLAFFQSLGQVYSSKQLTNVLGFFGGGLPDDPQLNERGERVARAEIFAPAVSIDFSPAPGMRLRAGRILAERIFLEMPPLDNFTDVNRNPWASSLPLRLVLERPFIADSEIRAGVLSQSIQNITAERIEVRMPSLAQIAQTLHLSPSLPVSDLFGILQERWMEIAHLCQVELVAPRMDERFSLRNAENGMAVEGRDAALSHGLFRFERSQDGRSVIVHLEEQGGWLGEFGFVQNNIGPLRLSRFDVQGVRFGFGRDLLRMNVERLQTSVDGSYEDSAANPTHLRLQGGFEFRNISLEQRDLGEGRSDIRLGFRIPRLSTHGVFRREGFEDITLRDLRIEDGRFEAHTSLPGSSAMGDYTIELSGNLGIDADLHFRNNFNIPGFLLDANLRDTRIAGRGHILFAHDRTVVETAPGAERPLTLTTHITQAGEGPRASYSRVTQSLGAAVPRSTDVIVDAQVSIGEANRFAFYYPSDGPHAMEMDTNNIQITQLSSAGEILAPVPLWQYLRARLATGGGSISRQEGRPAILMPQPLDCGELPSGVPNFPDAASRRGNFMHMGHWNIQQNNGRFQNQFDDLRICLVTNPLDRGNSRSFLLAEIPRATLTPNEAVPLQMSALNIDTAFVDLTRGGWMFYSTYPQRRHLYDSAFPPWSRPPRR